MIKTKPIVLTSILLAALAITAQAQTVGINAGARSAEPKTREFKWVTLTTGTNVPCSPSNLMVTVASFYGIKAATNNAAPTANTGTAYFGYRDYAGDVTTNNLVPAIFTSVAAGASFTVGNLGTKYNLADYYFVGSTGDKILVVFER